GNQIAALVGVMLLKGGRLVAAFGVNTCMPRMWTPMEIQLIREVAERTWAAVERAHAEAELRKAQNTLERRVRDRTAEIEARNTQLRRLASDLILAEQRAREGLANTLHNHFQQLLYSSAMKVDRAAKRDPKSDQIELLQQARANISEAIEAARTLSVDLFSPRLHESGLPVALAWLGQRTQQQYGITVNVTADATANPEEREIRTLIFESVRELLFNAVKHAQVDRVDIDLVLGAGDTIHLHVTDQGVGFDPALVVHDRHVGFGLFSIQERLALIGGRLDIQSAPGKGARFSLIIPRSDLTTLASGVTMPTADAVRQEPPVSHESASRTAKPLRILIADDHAMLRTGLRELFSERPELQVVAEATNGIEAISLAMSQHPDVIVMDVSMPQMDGIEATRRIHAALPHIEIVGLSTYVDAEIERSMYEAGAKAYFTKNESSNHLIEHLLSFRASEKGSA
ncbi:MAG TPA: response regulator, partial [Terriglobia bacterium]|nr:response regulator [Terriglobia bacterium]